MRPVVPSHPLIAAAVAAAVLAVPAAAGAATVRYEAESLTPSTKATWVARSTEVSGGRFRWLTSNGTLELSVPTGVTSFTVRVKGTPCANPVDAATAAGGVPTYQLRTYPGYFQQDAFIDPDPARLGPRFRTWAAGTEWSTWTFTLPYGGYNVPGPLTGGAPNRLQLRFLNDYKASTTCDRNLAVDYFEITE